MKKVLLLLSLLLPVFSFSQNRYTAVYLDLSKGKFISPLVYGYDNNVKSARGGLGIEHYFKFGLKVSAGLQIAGFTVPYQEAYYFDTAGNKNTVGYKHNTTDIQLPVTLGYNVTKGLYPFQFFFFAGYSRNYNINTTRRFYPDNQSTIVERHRYKQGTNNLILGIEARAFFLKKYYAGVSYSVNDIIPPGGYSFLYFSYSYFNFKAGIKLFQ